VAWPTRSRAGGHGRQLQAPLHHLPREPASLAPPLGPARGGPSPGLGRRMTEWPFHTGPRGLSLQVCEWGRSTPGRLPVLVLHGFLEQGAAWDGVAERLGGRVVAPDLRGHGRSDHVGPGGFYHFWDYVPDVLKLIAHLGGRVDLIGHSMGGTIAVLVAGLRPQSVRRMVNVEGLGPPDGDGAELSRAERFAEAMDHPPRHFLLDSIEAAAGRLRRW